MPNLFKYKTLEVVKAMAPLILVVTVLQFTGLRISSGVFIRFLFGALFAMAGMTLFLLGIEVGILPAGKMVGQGLVQKRSLWLIIAVTFLIAFSTTIAEPDVQVLSRQASLISGGVISRNALVYIIGIGLAFFAVAAMLRIILGVPMPFVLLASFVMLTILSQLVPPGFIALSFDSGSVTTGVLTAPIFIALGIGLSSVLAGRSAISDGFGLLGLASIGPIIAVLLMGMLTQ